MTQADDTLDEAPDHPDEVWAKKEFALLLHRLQHLPPRSRAKLQSGFAQRLLSETLAIETPTGPLSFVLLGRTAGARAVSLLTKQPATIQWIDSFRPDSVFWDIGANVGVYALYAARRGDTRVVAFEPAAVNYFLLAANCEANNLNQHLECLLLGLGSEKGLARLEVSQFEAARSFRFRVNHQESHPGPQAAIIMSIDQLIDEYQLPCPNYIKIDAPGMAEAILSGGMRTLQRKDVRELHIEVKEHSKAGQRILAMLERSGFVVAGRHAHGAADLTFARRSD